MNRAGPRDLGELHFSERATHHQVPLHISCPCIKDRTLGGITETAAPILITYYVTVVPWNPLYAFLAIGSKSHCEAA